MKGKMNCQQAKQIPIVQYLSTLGLKYDRISSNHYWYKSMLRHEKDASFKVDAKLNCWYDHGLGEGGNILDLVMRVYGLNSVSDALKKLSEKHSSISSSFHQQDALADKPGLRIIKVKDLQNKALLDYLGKERMISPEIARKYCCEVYYQIKGKRYFAIGFKNEKNGYELRNKYFKGCIGKKAVTLINNHKSACCAFEGFTDFMSFLQLFPGKEKTYDFLILNSTSKINDAVEVAKNYKVFLTFFDNDETGINASEYIQKVIPKAVDSSGFYKPFKDVNQYLRNKRI